MTKLDPKSVICNWKSESVCVITITRRRPRLLRRAIHSVASQQCALPIYHLILIDACVRTMRSLERGKEGLQSSSILAWLYCYRKASDVSGPGRSAVLRNFGTNVVPSDWVAFLDDDNEYESTHLQSLLDSAANTGCDAVHSHRQVFFRNGKPFSEPYDPWEKDELRAKEVYEYLLRVGVRTDGSNIFQDRIDLENVPDAVCDVDTSEWLFRRSLLQRVRFCETYTERDKEMGMWSEDIKLARRLADLQIGVGCTCEATLKYYLGGYSNKILGIGG